VPWLQSSELAAPNALRGLAPAPDGVVFASAAGTLYHAVQGTGGAVASAEPIYVLRPGDDPTGVALGADGRLFVALAGPGEVLVIGTDGKELTRIRQPGVLDRPAGVALAGSRLWISGGGSRVLRADV
jgi:DNA-binding beta-propeller fold protein YncE